jgi:O-methyltransferase
MRIVLFGTGNGMRDFLSILPAYIEIAGLSDNDVRKHGTTIQGYKVTPPGALNQLTFDYVVVTTRAGEAIRNQLIELGVARDRILLYYAHFDDGLRTIVNRDMEILNQKLGIGLHPVSLCTMSTWRTDSPIDGPSTQDDYCRQMSLRLAVDRILKKNVAGAIAELGVYKGEMAAVLNRLFPGRLLYLFDTFEGFSENDLADGQEKNFSSAAAGEFQETSVDLVLSRMEDPERVLIRKGYFPETAAGLEDTFALVSLDVDLYKPTLAGLEYFYPRLSPGGCVFIHDYNNLRFQGVRSAVDEFVDQSGAPMVQLPDTCGTAILPK